MSDVYLILHGTGGNKPDHWQEHLHKALRYAGKDVRYPKMPAPNEPQLDAWLSTLNNELDSIAPDANLTVLAHSRGSLLWMHHAALAADGQRGPQADRVLLVAPPHRLEEAAPIPPSLFYPAPIDPAGIAAVGRHTYIVASDNDDPTTFEQSSAYASALGIPIFKLADAGHISPFYGYGEWPWVTNWTFGLAGLPPQPNK